MTPKTADMPAHIVCRSCGWREPVIPGAPIGTRTWDSSRDEYRYLREKKRRAALDEQKQDVLARSTSPAPVAVTPRRRRRSNVIRLKRLG
ncbi:MAG: hypothetical protein IT184_14635 [Acidobacteria bacterium]|nr:hypothetical protein [Acidobacteriota bacterium]